MIFLVLIVYAVLILYEFIPLYKQKQWPEFAANAVLGVLSLTVAILLSVEVKIPSPSKPISNVITSVFGK
ncbi:MAG: hypothetical protein N2484_15270 [Clostridia bacterium]|nr:hypothetical protein [Clostridia bacterium]